MTRPNLNAVALVPDALDGQIASTGFDVLRPCFVSPRWLGYLVQTQAFVDSLSGLVQGALYPAVRAKDIRSFLAPIAPANEQSRIADKLDAIFARVSACRDRLDRLPAILSSYRQAVLTAAARGGLNGCETSGLDYKEDCIAPKNWKKETIGAVTVNLRYGTSKKCDYTPDGVGVLRIPNIGEHGRIFIDDMKWAKFDQSEIEKLALRSGDLLIIRSNGSVDLVGKASIVTEQEEGFLFAGYLMRLRVDTQKVLPKFIQVCLSTPEQRQRITAARKSTSGVNNINATEIRALPISYPTIEEQTEIVRRVESLFALADRIEARQAAARKQVEGLTPALLAKAFRGELVPQDANDEPASMLLARIAAARATTHTLPRTRKTSPRKATRTSKEKSAMTKSRQDDDVKEKPYLAGHLRRLGGNAHAEALFKAADLPVADFYKQLAWEVQQGLVLDGKTRLELPDAAR